MKQLIITTIKGFISILALSILPMVAQARDSLEALRNDLNTAVNQINAQQTQINNLQAQITALTPVVYAIGDTGPAGGIVFYVTDASGAHGLEAAPQDQVDAPWGCYVRQIGAYGVAVGTGAQNTLYILAGCAEPGTAAKRAAEYSLGGFDDWHLPSKDELNLLYEQRGVVGSFANTIYWSSTEGNSISSWGQDFSNGNPNVPDKSLSFSVRAIRAF